MFDTIFALAYILPNIYVFLRLGQLFVSKGYRGYYVLIYIFVSLIYPFAHLFSGGDSGFLIGFLGMIAGYILPFYLYLFLSVLFFDIFLLVNKLIKIFLQEKMKTASFRIWGLSVILLLSVGVVVAGAINFNTIRISAYHIEIPRKSSKIDHLKIAFAADFHLKSGTDTHFVERYAQEISRIQPDLMLYGGDIVEGGGEDDKIIGFEKILSEIHPKYGVYSVLGNHEFYRRQGKGYFFEKAGMKLLCDSTVVIDHSFNLTGDTTAILTGDWAFVIC